MSAASPSAGRSPTPPTGVEDALAATSRTPRTPASPAWRGCGFKTWRMRPGEWFEGCYVFETAEARDEFQRDFPRGAAESPGSQIVGSAPVLIEACEVVAVAEGWDGFTATPRA